MTIVGKEEVRKYLFLFFATFCSYIKHIERAHLHRRAIASPNIALRAMFLIIEKVHLRLGKRIEGSTISIGSEEKKIKNMSTMNMLGIDSLAEIVVQATQDATKCNECMTSQGFGMMNETFYDDEIRKELGLELTTPEEKLFLRIVQSALFYLANKAITLGDGLQGESDSFHGKISLVPENLNKLNPRTQEWFSRTIPYLVGNNYMKASGGMLMGMFNAMSTTYGLLAANYNASLLTKMYILRSSDDSMTMYTASDRDGIAALI